MLQQRLKGYVNRIVAEEPAGFRASRSIIDQNLKWGNCQKNSMKETAHCITILYTLNKRSTVCGNKDCGKC